MAEKRTECRACGGIGSRPCGRRENGCVACTVRDVWVAQFTGNHISKAAQKNLKPAMSIYRLRDDQKATPSRLQPPDHGQELADRLDTTRRATCWEGPPAGCQRRGRYSPAASMGPARLPPPPPRRAGAGGLTTQPDTLQRALSRGPPPGGWRWCSQRWHTPRR